MRAFTINSRVSNPEQHDAESGDQSFCSIGRAFLIREKNSELALELRKIMRHVCYARSEWHGRTRVCDVTSSHSQRARQTPQKNYYCPPPLRNIQIGTSVLGRLRVLC